MSNKGIDFNSSFFSNNSNLDTILNSLNTSDNTQDHHQSNSLIPFNSIQQQLLQLSNASIPGLTSSHSLSSGTTNGLDTSLYSFSYSSTSGSTTTSTTTSTSTTSTSSSTSIFPLSGITTILPLAPCITNTPIKNSDGSLQNAATLVVPFSSTVDVLNAGNITLTGTAIDPNTNNNYQVNIPIGSVVQDPNNSTQLIITTKELVPQNATLTFGAGSISDEFGDVQPTETAQVPTGLSKADFTMANRPFVASNINDFGSNLYPGATDYLSYNTPVPTSTAYSELQADLQAKVNACDITQTLMNSTLAQFNSASVQSIIPDANLRASVLSLVGTSTANSINAILGTDNLTGQPYKSVVFDPSVSGGEGARAVTFSDGTLGIQVNPLFQGEPLQELSGIMAHEALHQESNPGAQLPEEQIANFAGYLTYAEQLLYTPQVAQSQTALTQLENIGLLGMLNSGTATHIGLLAAPQPGGGPSNIYPNSNGSGVDSFASLIKYNYTFDTDKPTPGNNLLLQDIAAWTGKSLSSADFSDNTIQFINQNFNDLSSKQVLAVAHALQLTHA